MLTRHIPVVGYHSFGLDKITSANLLTIILFYFPPDH
jgi:hypothetical protein